MKKIRIGTRGSDLALAQTESFVVSLKKIFPDVETEVCVIRTSGDWKPEHKETRLSELDGGKGLFAKEIETALFEERIDCAVHSTKDMPSFLPDGLEMLCFLERGDPRDVFVSKKYPSFDHLPEGAVLGTASVRRAAFLKNRRPDLDIQPIRGNVPTRIRKMKEGRYDAIVLAAAGIQRLSLTHEIRHYFEAEDFIPACGQGVIGIEIPSHRTDLKEILSRVSHHETTLCTLCERAALQALDGSCSSPIGAYAVYDEGSSVLSFKCAVADLDGTEIHEISDTKNLSTNQEAIDFGAKIGQSLKDRIESQNLKILSA